MRTPPRMPASRPILPLADDIDSHEALLVREAAGTRRRRLKWWLAAASALALTVAGICGVRPALHLAKEWQARRLAREAAELIEEGNLDAAHVKVQDALAIWQLEPEAMHAAALLLTRICAYRQALSYWKELEAVRPLSPADLRDYANTEINLGDQEGAEALLRRVWPAGEPGTCQDWMLGMQIAVHRRQSVEAAALAKRLVEDAQTPPREQFAAATVLLSSTGSSPADRALAWKTVAAVAHDQKTPESLAALVLLAQQRANPSANQAAEEGAPSVSELMARIDAHAAAKTQHHLLVVDLRIAREPERRAELIQAAVDRFGTGKDGAELAVLAGWLYAKGEYERVLAVLPPARAANDRALYLQYLDALAALGRWSEIRELVQARKFPLDPMLAQMFLARCAAQLGETEVRDARWQAALDAAGADPGKLLALGQYAAKNGATSFAVSAYRAAIHAAPDERAPYEELLQILESTGDTVELRGAVKAMLARWPGDPAIRNDAAYLDALLNENLPAARSAARELVQAEPASIAHRVALALVELRLRNALAALDAFSGLDPGQVAALQPRQGAVYAAVLWETNFNRDAKAVIQNLPVERLLPEERALIHPIEIDASPR